MTEEESTREGVGLQYRPRLRLSAGREVAPRDGRHDHEALDLSLDEFAERLANPARGPKASGGYFLACEFAPGARTAADVIGPAAFVMLDLDSGDWDAASLELELDGIAFLAHTSSSHLKVNDFNPTGGPRFRVIVPLMGFRVSPAEHRLLARSLHRTLGLLDEPDELNAKKPDLCGTKLTQCVFWPTVETDEDLERFEFVDGRHFPPLSADEATYRIEDELEREAAEAAKAQADRECRRAERGGDREGASVIEAFNAAHDLAGLLVEFGYKPPRPPGKRWTSPRSESGRPSHVILEGADGRERVYSHRGPDEATEWQLCDSFDLYRLHAHAGDFRAAVRAASKKLGLDSRPAPQVREDTELRALDPRQLRAAAPDPPADDLFDEKGKFVPPALGAQLEAESPFLVGEGGTLYRYSRGVYRPDGEKWAGARVREVLGGAFRRARREEVIAWLSSRMPVDLTAPDASRLNVANGLLSWDGSTLEPHSPDFVSTIQIPVGWRPGAKCPRILAFLREVLPDEATVQLTLEIIGYALLPRNLFHVAVMLLGPGRNGKSVLLAIMQKLLGDANVANVPLQALGENRFAGASLGGKLANLCGDLDARAIDRTDLFKQLTGGDPVYAERKFKEAFSFRSFALPVFSANEPPQSSDQSEAWFERWVVLPMERTIPPERRVPDLAEKLATRAELEGLLVEALDALARLRARGRFVLPPSVEAAQASYRERLDSVGSFIHEALTFGPSGYVERGEVSRAYAQHCKGLDLRPVPAARLYDRIRAADPGVSDSKREGRRAFVGVSLR
jgi:putative DNA primase/helicase